MNKNKRKNKKETNTNSHKKIKKTEWPQENNKNNEDEAPKPDIQTQNMEKTTVNMSFFGTVSTQCQNMSCPPESSLASSSGIRSQKTPSQFESKPNGVKSVGFRYQILWCLWYVLGAHDLLQNQVIKDYQVSSENAAAGIFDDAVITIKNMSDKLEHILMQVKYKIDGSELKNSELQGETDDKYCIQDYLISFLDKLKKTEFPHNDILFLILATNRTLSKDIKKNFKEIDVKKLNIFPLVGKYYQLKDMPALKTYLNLNENYDLDLEQLLQVFQNKFVLAVGQPFISGLEEAILSKYKGLNKCDLLNMNDILTNWLDDKKEIIEYIDGIFALAVSQSSISDLKIAISNKYEGLSECELLNMLKFLTDWLDVKKEMKEYIDENLVVAVCQQSISGLETDILNKYKGLKECELLERKKILSDWLGRRKNKKEYINESFVQEKLLKSKCRLKKLNEYKINDQKTTETSKIFHDEIINFINDSNNIINFINDTNDINDNKCKEFYYPANEKHIFLNTIVNLNNDNIIYLSQFDDIDDNDEILWLFRNKILVVDNNKTLRYNERILLQKICKKIIILRERFELSNRVLTQSKCRQNNKKNKNVMILASDPGTGKTTQFKILENEYRSSETYKDCDIISMNADNFEFEKEKIRENKKFVLFFDAYDELSEEKQTVALEFLEKAYKKPKIQKLFISTRCNYKSQLEKIFKQSASSLPHLSRTEQKEILLKFTQDNILIDKVIRKINVPRLKNIYKNIMIFKLSIPFLIDSHTFLEGNLNKIDSIECVMDMMIDKICDKYLEKSDITSKHKKYKKFKESLLNDLQNIASKKLYNIENIKFLFLEEKTPCHNLLIYDKNDGLKFAHSLYEEYFLAKKLIKDNLEKVDFDEIFLIHPSCQNFDKWHYTRQFLDYFIKNIDSNSKIILEKNINKIISLNDAYVEKRLSWKNYPNLFLFILNCFSVDQKTKWMTEFKWTNLMILTLKKETEKVRACLASRYNKLTNDRIKSILIASKQKDIETYNVLIDHKFDNTDRFFKRGMFFYIFNNCSIQELYRWTKSIPDNEMNYFLENICNHNYYTLLLVRKSIEHNNGKKMHYNNAYKTLDMIEFVYKKIIHFYEERELNFNSTYAELIHAICDCRLNEIEQIAIIDKLDYSMKVNFTITIYYLTVEIGDENFLSDIINSKKYNPKNREYSRYILFIRSLMNNNLDDVNLFIVDPANIEFLATNRTTLLAIASCFGKSEIESYFL